MEFKDKNAHYLHPDFEEPDTESQKRPSPLALLVQTCKNINSYTESHDLHFFGSVCSPSSRKAEKRNLSDSPTNHLSLDKDDQPTSKRPRPDIKVKPKVEESKVADLSPDDSLESGCSLINNLINFVKGSNIDPGVPLAGKNDLIQFLTTKCEKENDFSKSHNKGHQFNVTSGYHLDSQGKDTPQQSVEDCNKPSQCQVQDLERFLYNSDGECEASKGGSAIKYCMYCGKFIPVLPILVTHIRLEHVNTTAFDTQPDDRFSGFLSYPQIKEDKSHQAFNFLTDYFSSPLKGLGNLIC